MRISHRLSYEIEFSLDSSATCLRERCGWILHPTVIESITWSLLVESLLPESIEHEPSPEFSHHLVSSVWSALSVLVFWSAEFIHVSPVLFVSQLSQREWIFQVSRFSSEWISDRLDGNLDSLSAGHPENVLQQTSASSHRSSTSSFSVTHLR